MSRLLALTLGATLLVAAEGRAANAPGALDLPPSSVLPAPVDVAPAAPRAERPADPTGNPLWAIPLSTLTATRERPLFVPTRRPPAPAVPNTPVAAAPPPPPPAAEPEQPPLRLVGAIAGDGEGFAVFLDQGTNNVVRLKTGQDFSGWVLKSVKGREATLEKNQRATTLALPAPNGDIAGEPAAAPSPPPPIMPRGPGPAALPRPGPYAPVGGHTPPVGAPKKPIPGDPRPLEDQL
jgi:general secretion pathway protein N